MQDVKSMTGMSEEMVQELLKRNSSLKKSLEALEDGQKTSHLQNEELRLQKSALQNLIGDLCAPEEAGGTSHNTTSRYLDSKYASKYDRSYDKEGLGTSTSFNASSKYLDSKYSSRYTGGLDSEDLGGTSGKTLPRYQGSKYESKYGGSYDNRYQDFDMNMEDKYHTKDLKGLQDGEKFSKGSKGDQYSFVFQENPYCKCSRIEN